MKKNVMILSITKNEITILKKKKRNPRIFLPAIFISFFVLCFATNINVLAEFKENILRVCSPVSSLYNDNSGVVFTNGGVLEKDTVNLILPIKGAAYEILEDGTVEFVVQKSIMVSSCDSGVVIDAGVSLDGVKFVTIKHNASVSTKIENIEILGVEVGETVKSGQDIATAKVDKIVRLRVFQNDVQVSNLRISKSKILWEN